MQQSSDWWRVVGGELLVELLVGVIMQLLITMIAVVSETTIQCQKDICDLNNFTPRNIEYRMTIECISDRHLI